MSSILAAAMSSDPTYGDAGDGRPDPGPGRPGHVCPRRSLAGRCRCEGGADHLKPAYGKRREGSLAKLEEALASLERGPRKGSVSLDSLHVRSVELRTAVGDTGIAVSTILDDPDCAALYYARRTRNPLKAPPTPSGLRRSGGPSARSVSRALRVEKAKTASLLRDIASLGGARARADRSRVDDGNPDHHAGDDG